MFIISFEIISCDDLTRYKDLKYDLKNYRRVHVNKSYVIIFYDDKDKKVYFIEFVGSGDSIGIKN